MIQVPKMFKEQQDTLAKEKIKEDQAKIEKFLAEEGLTIKEILNYGIDGAGPSIAVIPKEYLKPNKEEDKKEEESKIVSAS